MGKDLRYDKGWGKKRKGAPKNKRRASKKALKTDSSFNRKSQRTNTSSKPENFEDYYIDPDDGFEKFESKI
tara:strand:+ start:10803 stop:11015 length:213 start_codon:yes stop_codon:yes gene_type:complete